MGKEFPQVSQREDEIGRQIVDAAYNVHRCLGPELLESVYETAFVMS